MLTSAASSAVTLEAAIAVREAISLLLWDEYHEEGKEGVSSMDQRAQCEDPKLIGDWFKLVEDAKAKHGIFDHDVFNFDETGFIMGMISNNMVVTSAERNGRARHAQPGNREWITVVQGANAGGWCIPPFIIAAGHWHLEDWYEDHILPLDCVITTTHNGWTDNKEGLHWIDHFNTHTKNRTVGVYRLLVLDGHESHLSTEFERYCQNHNIITLCMPAHASHLLQPLDVGCFALVKRAYGKEIGDLIKLHISHITKVEFLNAFIVAHNKAMTKDNIVGGFRGAGLSPLNPEAVLSKLDLVVRTPSPQPRSSTPDLWVSQTPSNPTEAVSQSQFVRDRIAAHHGSSPNPIFMAVENWLEGPRF
jgi:hypothetical protein